MMESTKCIYTKVSEFSFPKTCNAELPEMAQRIHKAVVHLQSMLVGLYVLIESADWVGRALPEDGDSDAWSELIANRAKEFQAPVIRSLGDDADASLPAYLCTFLRLLEAEVARHR